MTRQEIIDKVKALDLPKNSYVVFGSCPMAAAGIREAGDIDFLVTKEVFEQFRQAGWKEVDKGSKDKPLTQDVYEAHFSWAFSPYNPTLEHLLATADWIGGVPFASLEEVRKWKAASGGPKHLADVGLIDRYLAKKTFAK